MSKLRALALFGVMLSLAIVLVNCGSSSGLRSVTITPGTADAQNFPNGQVPFAATGVFAGQGQSGPVNAMWWNSQPWAMSTPIPATGFNITSAGVATCTGFLTGTFTLWATAPIDQTLPLSKMTKSTPQRMATAQITCP